MKCEECLPLLEEYFDQELAAPVAVRMGEHLERCPGCAAAYRELSREQYLYLINDGEMEISPHFWPGVFARLREERAKDSRSRLGAWFARLSDGIGALRFGPAMTTAIVLIAIVATVAVMRYLEAGEQVMDDRAGTALLAAQESGDAKQTAAREESERKSEQGRASGGEQAKQRGNGAGATRARRAAGARKRSESPDALVREAEQKYLAAIALLMRDARARRSQLDSQSLAQFDRALAEIDRMIAGTRRTVRERPDDPVAVQYMLAAYARKVDVLREMAGN